MKNLTSNNLRKAKILIAVINSCKYEINVTAENVRSIVQSVVNRVALKLRVPLELEVRENE